MPSVIVYPTRSMSVLSSSHGTWATARNGYQVRNLYPNPVAGIKFVATWWFYRNFIWVPEINIPPAAIKSAKFYFYCTNIPSGGVWHLTRGVDNEPIIDQVGGTDPDWDDQTAQATSGGSIDRASLVLNAYNAITLNATGISWLDQDLAIYKTDQAQLLFPSAEHFLADSAQSFTPVYDKIRYVKMRCRILAAAGDTTLYLKLADANDYPTGPALATVVRTSAGITNSASGRWYIWDFGSEIPITPGVKYCLELKMSAPWNFRLQETAGNPYAGGKSTYDTGGGVWAANGTYDHCFAEYSESWPKGTWLCLKGDRDLTGVEPAHGDYDVTFQSPAQANPPYLVIDYGVGGGKNPYPDLMAAGVI